MRMVDCGVHQKPGGKAAASLAGGVDRIGTLLVDVGGLGEAASGCLCRRETTRVKRRAGRRQAHPRQTHTSAALQ